MCGQHCTASSTKNAPLRSTTSLSFTVATRVNCWAGCDIYANTSPSDGVSLTILEAMAAGLPIVATEVGGTL